MKNPDILIALKPVIGVLKVQEESLDKIYLRKWSQKLHIMELLDISFERIRNKISIS